MSKEEYKGPRVKDTETFIRKARWKHGDKYDYSRVEYQKDRTPVLIVCPHHGVFKQSPNAHAAGKGCADCGGSLPLSSDRFISKARDLHGDRYDYSLVDYSSTHVPVTIVCPDHGNFRKSPANHISGGQGCPSCTSLIYTNKTKTQVFIERSINIHGDVYDYSKSEYVNSDTKIEIVCPTHGTFWKSPSNHTHNKQGCPECTAGDYQWNPNSAYGLRGYYGTGNPSNLYILLIDSLFIKVGLARDVEFRRYYITYQSGYATDILKTIQGSAKELWGLEQSIHRDKKLQKYNPEKSFGGEAECYKISELPKVLQIIEDWEGDQKDA